MAQEVESPEIRRLRRIITLATWATLVALAALLVLIPVLFYTAWKQPPGQGWPVMLLGVVCMIPVGDTIRRWLHRRPEVP